MRDAFRALARHRFLTARQLAVAVGVPAERLDDVLRAFVAEGLLVALDGSGDAPQTAFALTRPGVAFLARSGEAVPPRAVVPKRATYTLAHELGVNDLAIALERLHARGATQLLDWQTARERIADVTHLNVKGRVVRVPLVADALAVFGTSRGRTGLLVEIDMGTVSATRMRTKYAGYHAWWKDGGPARRLGLAATRVLTIASTRRRMERLRAIACEAVPPGGSALFWFLSADAVDPEKPERLLDPVARVARAGDDTPRTLFAAAAAGA
ncbi:MAG: hypothetical protein JWM10_3058 [Myxococcaceae bacterium]|nr:hypothetical protein [Myxococcaceae bacterium]